MEWQPKTLSKPQQEERRLEGGRLLLDDMMSQAAIAEHFGVSQATVSKWEQRLKTHNNDVTDLEARMAPGARSVQSQCHWLVDVRADRLLVAPLSDDDGVADKAADGIAHHAFGSWRAVCSRRLSATAQRLVSHAEYESHRQRQRGQ
jgi:hypothetical protein